MDNLLDKRQILCAIRAYARRYEWSPKLRELELWVMGEIEQERALQAAARGDVDH